MHDRSFSDLDEYFSHYGHGPHAPTPIVGKDGRVRALSSLLNARRREGVFSKVRRMADLITNRVTFGRAITRDELLGGGFSEAEITTLYPLALRRSGVAHLGTHL